MADGFLGRWSRRKLDVKEGKPVEAEPVPVVVPVPVVIPAEAGTQGALDSRLRGNDEVPPPTMEDVQALTPQSDFSAFTGRNVQPEVSNAAMKKLFADPHYNIMDRMDVYIDDYSKPDPIPASMLRQLASARFLGLFDEEEKAEAAARAREGASGPAETDVAQSGLCTDLPGHADPDLRLQQDDAPAGKAPGDGAQ